MPPMRPRLLAVAALSLTACSPPAAPQPGPVVAQAKPEPAKSEPAKPEPAKPEPARKVYTPEELDKIGPRPKPEPPLTPEELELLAADSKELSKEMRIKQAYARRRKILQSPDSPQARQIEALRLAHERGELRPPQLPDRSPAPAAPSP